LGELEHDVNSVLFQSLAQTIYIVFRQHKNRF